MRRLLVALALAGLMSEAVAGEFELPTLRGSNTFVPEPPTYYRWSGFYVGGHLGMTASNFDFSGATESLVAFILRNSTLQDTSRPSEWKVLTPASNTHGIFGGFIGYNSQWDDVVLGVDLTYNWSGSSAAASVTPLTRVTSPGDGFDYTTTVSGSASMRIVDYSSLRARAGFIIGNLLPFATAGVAFGRVDYTRSATVVGTYLPSDGSSIIPVPFGPWTQTETRKNALAPGFSVGFGIDVAVLPTVFLRGEYEYVRLGPVGDIPVSINSVRAGAAVKF